MVEPDGCNVRNALLLPFREAVIVAFDVEAAEPAVAVKLAPLLPDAMRMEGGTVTRELSDESITLTPPEGAAPLRLTVQDAVEGVIKTEGLQARPATEMSGWIPVTEMEPPDPDDADAEPVPTTAAVSTTPMASEDAVTFEASVRLTAAMTPFGMVAELFPAATHTTKPVPGLQLRVLPAVPRAAPAVRVADEIPAG